MVATPEELYFQYSSRFNKKQDGMNNGQINEESEVLRIEIKTAISDQLELISKQEEDLLQQLEKLVSLKKQIEKHYVPPPAIQPLEVSQQDIENTQKSQKRKMGAAELEDLSTISDESDFLSNGNLTPKSGKKSKKAKVVKEPKPKKIRETKVCHVCHRQFIPSVLLTCTATTVKNKKCGISFCAPCLKRRHGEDYKQALASGCWVCAKCRGNCGPGCIICCTCGTCRKNAKLPIVSKISGDLEGIPAEFDNMHDKIIHLATGESAEEIKARKLQHSWGKFLLVTNTSNSVNINVGNPQNLLDSANKSNTQLQNESQNQIQLNEVQQNI